MKSTLLVGTAVVAGIGLTVAFGQTPIQPVPGQNVAVSADEAMIRSALDAYATAFNHGDIDSVMSFWADGSEFITENGMVVRGKDAVGDQFRKGLAANQGRTIQIKISSIRLLRPDLAVLDGAADMTNADGTSDKGPFTSTWTKSGERWFVLSVRDLPSTDEDVNPSAAELRSLDWLVGDWTYQDKDTVVTLSCKKTQKQTFLRIDQVVKVKGEETLSLTQVIGWDPLARKFRSWVFDSAGGYGNGLWERRGNAWIVNAEGVRTDGRTASGANQWRFIDANTFEWTANDRQIGGEPQPDLHARYNRVMGK